MMNKTKRNITIAAVLLCVCAAVYLNWSYNNGKAESTEMTNAELANAKAKEEALSQVSDYFAEARLTRQQSRDEALALLETAAASETASKETIDGAMTTIAAMANFSMMETQIENLLLAKDFAECVAFMSAEGVTLAIPAPAEGLKAEDVAKITDAIVSETDYDATQINIIEVKKEIKNSEAAEGGAEQNTGKNADANKGAKAGATGESSAQTGETKKDNTAKTTEKTDKATEETIESFE